jgi:hypothetical protein
VFALIFAQDITQVFSTPIFLGFAFIGVVLAFFGVCAYLSSRSKARENAAILAELAELRDEVIRLREENERLRSNPLQSPTSIKSM